MHDAIRTAVLALLSILAIALAAATLDSTLFTGGSGEGSGGVGGGSEGALPIPAERGTTGPGETVRIPYVEELVLVLAVLATIAVLYYLYHNWREALWMVLGVIALVVGGYLLVVLFSTAGFELPFDGGGAPNGSLFGGGGGGGSGGSGGDDATTTLPSLMLLVVLGLALAGAIVATVRSGSSSTEEVSDSSERSPETAAVGRAAGRAAERIEDADTVDNEVYRAWREMTSLLEVSDPESATPGEFASAAVDAGMDRDDVVELTRLFEDVRYGESEPSADHERRAVEIFRRIEKRYAEERS